MLSTSSFRTPFTATGPTYTRPPARASTAAATVPRPRNNQLTPATVPGSPATVPEPLNNLANDDELVTAGDKIWPNNLFYFDLLKVESFLELGTSPIKKQLSCTLKSTL